MGKTYDAIDGKLAEIITAQKMFFVATAPLDQGGHVNLSPKGLDTFRVLDPRTVAYLDYVGSGVETIAHLRDNGRITLMFCTFEGPPKIVRLYGRGEVIEPGDARFALVRANFPVAHAAVRSVIVVTVGRVADSCGYGVPRYEYQGERTQLSAWSEHKTPAQLAAYQRQKNRVSIDGLPGLRSTHTEESE